jgi:hypothetical protein
MTPMQPTTSYGDGCQVQIHHGCTTNNVTEHHHHNAASQDEATASQLNEIEGLLTRGMVQLKTMQKKVEEVQEKVEEAASAAKETKRLVEIQSDKPKKRKVNQKGEEHESTRRKCRTDVKERRRLSYGHETSVPRVARFLEQAAMREKWIKVPRAPKAGDHVMVMKEGKYKGKVGTYGGRGGWVGGLIEGSTMNVQILIKDLQVVEKSR